MSDLGSRTWPDSESAAGSILAVPVGSTEQHGPHLPLDTDTRVAVALCERLAQRVPSVIVAPALAYGASGEHQSFAGTVSLGCEVLEAAVVELVRSATCTFTRVLLVNGHGGNAVPLTRAVVRLRAEDRDVRLWSPRVEGDAHAGRTETALMLAIAPELVRLHAAQAGATEPLSQLLPRIRAGTVRDVAANGVLGDPTGASAEEGCVLLDELARQLVESVQPWQS